MSSVPYPAGVHADSGGGRARRAAAGFTARIVAGLRRPPGRWLKPAVFAIALAPALYLVHALFTNRLGANPIEALTKETGELALKMLVASLALTPLRYLVKNTWPIRFRRMLGLFAFFYACLHVSIWVVLDQRLDLAAMWADVLKRPYILAGLTAFLMLIPLAATSTKRIARRMKGRWTTLHRFVYPAAAAASVHFVWLAKGDIADPYVYLGILLGLFIVRFAKAH